MYTPHYHITNSILDSLTQIEAIRSRVASSYIVPEREIELRYRATVEATHSSTSIEGNPLNIKQVEKILSDKTPLTRHQYAEIEVKNYKKAIDFIDKRKTVKEKITTQDILDIHKIITKDLLDDEKVGAWRQNQVYIENQKGETIYDGSAPEIVPVAIEKLLAWLNDESYDINPVIAAALLHFQFVSIHPFADGNGRTTRALVSLYLGLRDYDFKGSLVLDSYYSTDKKAYYNALHESPGVNYEASQKNDVTSWIEYFAEGFLSAAKVLAAEVTLLSSIASSAPGGKKLTRDEMDLISYVNQFGQVALSEAEDVLARTPRRTVQRRLKNLVDEGYLKMDGSTNSTTYIMNK